MIFKKIIKKTLDKTNSVIISRIKKDDYKKIISNYSELEELVSQHFDKLDII